ncbi:MAG: ROK family protein [Thermoprotei archaeon]|nr:MAG: ROK family protein [Thermoprotei archaeon]RLF01399.1 MAG: ROK family protein [Thermoprotei archaeon]
MSYVVGVDIGATYTRVVLSDRDANFLDRIKERTPRSGGSMAVARAISRMIEELLARNGVGRDQLRGIGVGSIGPLDIKRGILVKPANLPIENIPIVEPLREEFGVPTYLVNDCVAAVIGERYFGAGCGHEDLVYITISTGIGGGIYVDGHLLLGKDGNAHEIGHMVVDAEGKLTCGCGKRGHWEAYSSGSGIPKLASLIAAREVEAFEKSSLYPRSGGDALRLTSKDVYEAAKGGDEFALKVVREAGRYNAIGVANVVSVYDPSLITLGGSVTLNNVELVLEPIRRMAPDYTVNRMPEIDITPLGEDVGLYGAVALALGLEKLPLK